MKRVIVGFFRVPDVGPDSVETPLTGNGKRDYATLQAAIEKKYPKAKKGSIKRVGSVVEMRDESNAYIEVTPGMTIGQLFGASETEENAETNRTIGRVFFNGSPADVVLVFLKAQGFVRLQLSPLLRGEGPMRFSNQINAQRQVSEVPQLVKEILGGDARDLKLKFRAPKQG